MWATSSATASRNRPAARRILAGRRRVPSAPFAEADAEILALTATAFQTGGLSDFYLVVGQMHFFFGLLEELQLAPPPQAQLLRAIEHKSEPELAEFLQQTPLATAQRRAVEQLLDLHGADPLQVIELARALSLNDAMHQSLDNLQAIYRVLDAYGVADCIHLDLTGVPRPGLLYGHYVSGVYARIGFCHCRRRPLRRSDGTFGAPNRPWA